MPPITFDARSLIIAGRRTTLAGAGLEYAALDPDDRAERLRVLAGLGFNTVLASCPWMLHEAVTGRFDFAGRLDLPAFLDEAHAAGLRVVLRIGPAIGSPFDGAGLPPWLSEIPGMDARGASPEFMERVATWFRALADAIADRQADADGGGPLVAIQIEHDWRCGSIASSHAYLLELLRYVRERGFTIPVLTANGFWSPVEGAIETWCGWDDLFTNIRQMVAIQSEMPRICVVDRGLDADTFRRPGVKPNPATADDLVGRVARVLASGGQPVVAHAVAGAFPAGVVGADDHGPIAASPFVSPLVDESGRPTDRGHAVGRVARFVRDFGAMVADVDPDDRPLVLDPDDPSSGAVIVPRRGGLGDLVVAFGTPGADRVALVDAEGRRISIDFGLRGLAWRLFDADLAGRGRLDFASATPLALVDGRLLVLSAPARAEVEVSIDGRPLDLTTPAAGRNGVKPVVVEHAGFVIVLIADEAAESIIDVAGGVVIGATHVRRDGSVEAASGVTPWRVGTDGSVAKATVASSSARRRRPKSWSVWREPDPLDPGHPRSIPFDGPLGLASTGTGLDHAWLTASIRLADAKQRDLRFLGGLGDARAWLDDATLGNVVDGTLALKAAKGDHRLGLFVRHRRRHVDGVSAPTDADRPGALVAVRPLAAVKRSRTTIDPIDPFTLARYVAGAADGELTATDAAVFAFTHRRKSAVLVEIAPGAGGVVIVNDVPHAVFGRLGARVVLSSADVEAFKAGANRIAGVPFEHVAEAGVEPTVSLFEVVEELVPADGWRMRRWEPSPDERIGAWEHPAPKNGQGPRWIRGIVPGSSSDGVEGAVLELDGLVRGRVRVNDVDLGGYDLREPGGRVAPGSGGARMAIPARLVSGVESIVIDIFDESGADPAKVAVRF